MPERETIVAAVEPVLTPLGLQLFDVQFTGSGRARTVRVVVDRDGGVDLDAIAASSERIQPVLDDLDLGDFALEVSSPGLERPLSRPEHYRRAVGETVSVKVRDAGGEARRVRGELVAADERGITVEFEHDAEHVDYDQIVQARTIFEWGAAPKKDQRARKRAQKKQKEVAR
ncbi:MAG TPA: ribosome maturation factor RimP [Acidimicrobiia bacterium]|nr:ribosome maturation factor RimP [Acidimicrobiia bacterium]